MAKKYCFLPIFFLVSFHDVSLPFCCLLPSSRCTFTTLHKSIPLFTLSILTSCLYSLSFALSTLLTPAYIHLLDTIFCSPLKHSFIDYTVCSRPAISFLVCLSGFSFSSLYTSKEESALLYPYPVLFCFPCIVLCFLTYTSILWFPFGWVRLNPARFVSAV